MRYLSICSGIEAASVAWLPLKWEPVAFSEIDPFPCSVLTHHYPDVLNLGDMTQIDGKKYNGTVELIIAGTPCQDLSVAGKRAGLAGERSGLAFDFIRLLADVRPRWFIWENVPGAFSTHNGRDFGILIKKMDEIGYSLAWRVLDAQFWGVPQRRRRIFLVGHSGDWRGPAAVLFDSDCLRGDPAQSRKKGKTLAAGVKKSPESEGYIPDIVGQAISCKWSKGASGPSGAEHHNLVCVPWAIRTAQTSANGKGYAQDCAYTLDRANGQAVIAPQARCVCEDGGKGALLPEDKILTYDTSNDQTLFEPISFHGSQNPCVSGSVTNPLGRNRGLEACVALPSLAVRRLTPVECERLQGFPDQYTDVPHRGKPAADGPRYKALGNAMAVPVVRWIGERIQRVENEM